MAFIAGAFNATFNAKVLGTTEDGFELSFNRIQEEIRVDAYRGLVDGIFQGIDMTIRTVLMEANLAVINDLLWAFDHDNDGVLYTGTSPNFTADTGMGESNVPSGVGQLISTMAAPLVLTPCGGTTAKTAGAIGGGAVATITFPKVVLATDPVALKFASSLRKVPIALHVLPYYTASATPSVFPACGTSMNYYTVA